MELEISRYRGNTVVKVDGRRVPDDPELDYDVVIELTDASMEEIAIHARPPSLVTRWCAHVLDWTFRYR